MKQIKLFDIDNDKYHGGILLDDGSAVCGCCGSLLPADERLDRCSDPSEATWKIVETYDTWIDLDEEITGDDL